MEDMYLQDKTWTPLMLAAYLGQAPLAQLIIGASAIIDQADAEGWTALMLAAMNSHAAVVQALIRAGAQVDQANTNGGTALRWAVTSRIN